MHGVTRADVLAAAERIRGYVHETPVLRSTSLDALCGVNVLFKCENLQKSGSFKYRGAANAVLSLDEDQRRAGVATHSSGNHGSALAAVARSLGVSATIVVPRGASAFKRAAIRRYGGIIVECGDTLAEREAKLAEVVAAGGATFVPPYDHPHIVAGQGTAAVEVARQVDRVDEVWVPVGGGGLAAGTIIARPPDALVVGAEPALAGDAALSMETGVRQPAMPPVSCADGLRTALGELNFVILKRYGLKVRLVAEDEIVAAQNLAMSCLKVLIEPSSAVALAALIKYGAARPTSRTVVIIVSGGNVLLESR